MNFSDDLSIRCIEFANNTGAIAPASTTQSPAEIVGIIVIGGVVLFGVVTATDMLGLPALTAIVKSLIQVLGQILSGLLVFGVGLYLANLAFNLIAASGSGQVQILGHTARIAIISFIGAMALRQIRVATDIVNLAFGLLLGAVAVAIAIAFGWGGKDIAAEQMREWLTSFKQAPAPTPAAATAATSMPVDESDDYWPPVETEDPFA
jgi:hypothetical protein